MYAGLSNSDKNIKEENITNSFDESNELFDTHDVKDMINSRDEISFLIKAYEVEKLTNSFDETTTFLDTQRNEKDDEIAILSFDETNSAFNIVDTNLTTTSQGKEKSEIQVCYEESSQRRIIKDNCLEKISPIVEKQEKKYSSQFSDSRSKVIHSRHEKHETHFPEESSHILDTEADIDEEWSFDREGDFIEREMSSHLMQESQVKHQTVFTSSGDERNLRKPKTDVNYCKECIERRAVGKMPQVSTSDRIMPATSAHVMNSTQKAKKPRQRYKVRFFSYPKKSESIPPQKPKQYFEIHIRPPPRPKNMTHVLNLPKHVHSSAPASAPLNVQQVQELKISLAERNQTELQSPEKRFQRLLEWEHCKPKLEESSQQYYYKHDTSNANNSYLHVYPEFNPSSAHSMPPAAQGSKTNIKRWLSKLTGHSKSEKSHSPVPVNEKWVPKVLHPNSNYPLYGFDRQDLINEIHNITQRINILTENEFRAHYSATDLKDNRCSKFGSNISNIFSSDTGDSINGSAAATRPSPVQYRVMKRKVVDATRRVPPRMQAELPHGKIHRQDLNRSRREYVSFAKAKANIDREKLVRLFKSERNAHNTKFPVQKTEDSSKGSRRYSGDSETSVWSDNGEANTDKLKNNTPSNINLDTTTSFSFVTPLTDDLIMPSSSLDLDFHSKNGRQYVTSASSAQVNHNRDVKEKAKNEINASERPIRIEIQKRNKKKSEDASLKSAPLRKHSAPHQPITSESNNPELPIQQEQKQRYQQQQLQKQLQHQYRHSTPTHTDIDFPQQLQLRQLQQKQQQQQTRYSTHIVNPEQYFSEEQPTATATSVQYLQQQPSEQQPRYSTHMVSPEQLFTEQQQPRYSTHMVSQEQYFIGKQQQQPRYSTRIVSPEQYVTEQRQPAYSTRMVNPEHYPATKKYSSCMIDTDEVEPTEPRTSYSTFRQSPEFNQEADKKVIMSQASYSFPTAKKSTIGNERTSSSDGKLKQENQEEWDANNYKQSDMSLAFQDVSSKFIEAFEEESHRFLKNVFKSFQTKIGVDMMPPQERERYRKRSGRKSKATDSRKDSSPIDERFPEMSLGVTERNRLSNSYGGTGGPINQVHRREDKDEATCNIDPFSEERFFEGENISSAALRRKSIHRVSTNEESFLMQAYAAHSRPKSQPRNDFPSDLESRFTDEEKCMIQTLNNESRSQHAGKPIQCPKDLTAEEAFLMNTVGKTSITSLTEKACPGCENDQKANCNVKNHMIVEPMAEKPSIRRIYQTPNTCYSDRSRETSPGNTNASSYSHTPIAENLYRTVIMEKEQDNRGSSGVILIDPNQSFKACKAKRYRRSKIVPCCSTADSAPSSPYNRGCLASKTFKFHPLLKTYDRSQAAAARFESQLGRKKESRKSRPESGVKVIREPRCMETNNAAINQGEDSRWSSDETQEDTCRTRQKKKASRLARAAKRRTNIWELLSSRSCRFHPHISKNQLQSEMQRGIVFAHKKQEETPSPQPSLSHKKQEEAATYPASPSPQPSLSFKRVGPANRMTNMNTAVLSKLQPSHNDLLAIRTATRDVREISRQQERRIMMLHQKKESVGDKIERQESSERCESL